MPPDEKVTERLSDRFAAPLSATRAQRVAILSWTDRRGPQTVTIEGPRTVGSTADPGKVVIDDPSVSRAHCEIEPTDAGIVIRDLGSTNGTCFGVLAFDRAVAAGDVQVRLGRVDLSIRSPAETVAARLYPKPQFGRMVGASAVMRGLFEQLSKIAPSDLSVLIHGESGTGKELVAEAIHLYSKRSGETFRVVDCSAISPSLIESELFGHARGSFTGASDEREGAFEAADGGTLFLDEIGELPLEMQPKLLRVLEAKTIKRIGENEYRPVNVRVIAASHRDLREMINKKLFREDLYFRIAGVPIRLPPLRERREDIPLIATHILRGFGREPVIPDAALAVMMSRPWDGNVRELRNVLEASGPLGWGAALALAAELMTGSLAPPPPAQAAAPTDPALLSFNFYEARTAAHDGFERGFLKRLFERYPDDIGKAAIVAGMHVTTLRKLRRRHRL